MTLLAEKTAVYALVTTLFFAFGLAEVNSVQAASLKKLSNCVKQDSFGEKQNLDYQDQTYVVKQLLRFKVLLYLFFFSQFYDVIKAVFVYGLNLEANMNFALRLYGQDSELVFSSRYDAERDLFNRVEYCEYFFKMVFCYLSPVWMVLVIIKKDFKYETSQRINGVNLATDAHNVSGNSNHIPGMNFHK